MRSRGTGARPYAQAGKICIKENLKLGVSPTYAAAVITSSMILQASKFYRERKTDMPIISVPPYGLNRSAELRGSKQWFKTVRSVDTTKDDGFAFTGALAEDEA